jgi:hypothetical protein
MLMSFQTISSINYGNTDSFLFLKALIIHEQNTKETNTASLSWYHGNKHL